MNAVIGSVNFKDDRVVDDRHQPIVRTRKRTSTVGEMPAGTIVAKDGAETIVAYDPSGTDPVNKPIGVLTRVSADGDDLVQVLEHGLVYKDGLLTKGTASDDAAVTALENNTIVFVTKE